jgi:hypothetical protein
MVPVAELSVEDVLITHELENRAPKKTDYLQEKIALQELAAKMADRPDAVLPRFVELAMTMTGGCYRLCGSAHRRRSCVRG